MTTFDVRVGDCRTLLREMPAESVDMTAKCCYSAAMKKITIRMTDELHERMTTLAKAERRSLQSQLLVLIEDYVEERLGGGNSGDCRTRRTD